MTSKKAWVIFIVVGVFLTAFVAIAFLLIDYSDRDNDFNPKYYKEYFESAPVVEKLSTTGEFTLSDYEEYIELFPSDKIVESIKDREDAKNKALNLIMEEYGMLNGKPYDPLKYTALATYFDAEAECWLVKGLSHPELTGAQPGVIIRQNGEVLAVFYS